MRSLGVGVRGNCAGYSQSIGESADAVQKLDESVYLVSTEARKVLPSTVKLANIETFSLMVQGFWGVAQTPVKLTNAKVEAQNGLYNWTYEEETKSVTFIVKYMVHDSLGGIVESVKVKLVHCSSRATRRLRSRRAGLSPLPTPPPSNGRRGKRWR